MNNDIKNVTLFPKKSSLLGLGLSVFLVTITASIVVMMWNSLKKIDEYHFPMIERSAINVRLVNLIDYQFKLAASEKKTSIVQDLKINFTSLEQNFASIKENTDIDIGKSEKLFSQGKEIINLLNQNKWNEAQVEIDNTSFLENLEEFSFDIFDSTEALAEQRDKNSQQILGRIRVTVMTSAATIIFLIILIRRIYLGYSENLNKRIAAEERANILSKQRETLIHVLCHDLGNPISAIFSLTEVGHLLDEKAKENMIGTIKDNAKESLDIIDLTRKMQALEAGKFSLELKDISVKSSLNKSLKTLDEKIKSKELIVKMDIPEDFLVNAEETTLVNSIFNNILTNSIKFSHHGGEISISSSSTSDFKEVVIEDYGVGMPEELLNVLFSETEQTSRKGTDGEIGTGFGMPLVKKFMESYGGDIIVSSSTEEGCSGTKTRLLFK
jgi:signal transduction histidine kinase